MAQDKYEFDITDGDWRVTSTYADSENIVFYHKGEVYKKITYPSYKIWNVPAHFKDIIADFDEGMAEASSTGFGGSVGYEETPHE